MGWDGTSFLAKGTKPAEVGSFLEAIGFVKVKPHRGDLIKKVGYYKPDDDPDHKYLNGLYVEVTANPEGPRVWTRANISRTRNDRDLHNWTLRQLRGRFGGHWQSDFGRNRYFTDDAPNIAGAECACLKAFHYFHASRIRASLFLSNQRFDDETWYPIKNLTIIDAMNPKLVATNVIVPFLVSAIEEYFRATYVALLRFSEKRSNIFKNAKITEAELIAIGQGHMTVEQAVARWRSFQDMRRITESFGELDKRINVHAVLSKPYNRRKESLYQTFERLIEMRHALIHRAELDVTYLPTHVTRDLDSVDAGVKRLYKAIIAAQGWDPDFGIY
jgi:hypothetical protein